MNIIEIVSQAAATRNDRPCSEAADWMRTLSAETTPEQAWNACEDARWLLWLCGILRIDRKLVVLAACAIAETALVHVKPGEDRPRIAIETARRWTRGEATIEEVREARRAYAADAYAADAAYAAAAYDAAAYAADAAYAYAAYAYADAADARSASLKRSADLVREIVPWSAIESRLIDIGVVP